MLNETKVGDVLRLRREWNELPKRHWVVVEVGEKVALRHMTAEPARLTSWVIHIEADDLRRFDKLRTTMPVHILNEHSIG